MPAPPEHEEWDMIRGGGGGGVQVVHEEWDMIRGRGGGESRLYMRSGI